MLRELRKDLPKFGFLFKINKEGEVIFSGLPSGVKKENLQGSIEDVLEQFINNEFSVNERNDKLALSLSTFMSIQEEKPLKEKEMKKINDELINCNQSNFSPKGKPIIINLDINQINKLFK